MDKLEIIGLIVAILGLGSFSAIFTILYSNYTNSLVKEYAAGKKDIELIDESIYDNLAHVKHKRKVIKTIKSIGFYGLMIIIAPFFIMAVISKFNNDVTMFANKGIIVVATGSMSEIHENNQYLIDKGLDDQFDAYEIIVLEKVTSDSQLEVYDIISYINGDGVNIIHRIVAKTINADGTITYTTRGDANGSDDSYKPTLDDVVGKYTGSHVPYIGSFVLFMQSSIGMITIISLFYCLIMMEAFSSKIEKAQNSRLKILSSAIDYTNETSLGKLQANYREHIFYKGYEYIFDETGFVDKKEITDETYLEESSDSIVKVIDSSEDETVISKEVIDVDEKQK